MPSTDRKLMHEGREEAFRMLFARNFDRESDSPVFTEGYFGAFCGEETSERLKVVALGLFEGADAYSDSADAVIGEYSEGWKLSRLSVAVKTVLRLAVYEMAEAGTPPKVVINEAVELTKKYDSEKAAKFVNGILNRYARNTGLISDAAPEEEPEREGSDG